MSSFIENSEMYALVFLIILIGQGWSIFYMDIESKNDLALPIFITFALFGSLLHGLNFLVDDEIDKFHAFYKGFGVLALLFRIVFFVYFLHGVVMTFIKKI